MSDPATANIVLFGGIILIMYFFMLRPQMKKAREQQTFLDNLQKGDKIVTVGGIHGKVTRISDQTLVIQVEDGAKLKIEKSVVSLDYSQVKDTAKS